MRTRVGVLALVCLLGFGAARPGAASAVCDTNTGAQVVDGVFVRPPMVAVSLVTTVLYVGTAPLTWLMDVDEEASEALVTWPWWFTSGRCLGQFGTSPCDAADVQADCEKGWACCGRS